MPAVGAAADQRGHGRAGELIAFAAVVMGHSQIFTVRPDGTGLRHLASHPDVDFIAPEWSPDVGRSSSSGPTTSKVNWAASTWTDGTFSCVR